MTNDTVRRTIGRLEVAFFSLVSAMMVALFFRLILTSEAASKAGKSPNLLTGRIFPLAIERKSGGFVVYVSHGCYLASKIIDDLAWALAAGIFLVVVATFVVGGFVKLPR